MKDPKGTHPVSIILPEQEYQELQKLARKTGRSTSGYFRQVLRWFLRSRGDCLEPQDYFQKKGSEEWESSGGPLQVQEQPVPHPDDHKEPGNGAGQVGDHRAGHRPPPPVRPEQEAVGQGLGQHNHRLAEQHQGDGMGRQGQDGGEGQLGHEVGYEEHQEIPAAEAAEGRQQQPLDHQGGQQGGEELGQPRQGRGPLPDGAALPVQGQAVLEQAAGHLEGSSLPIGGESTHTVITAHRGLPSAALFTDLDRLEEGDHFLIHVLDETLCYEVDKILTVEPDETDALAVEEGEDLATLVTCTPYGVNTHRLMVRGHRVPYVEEEVAGEKVPLSQISLHTSYLLWVIVGLTVTGLFILFLYGRDRKARARAAAPEASGSPAKERKERRE